MEDGDKNERSEARRKRIVERGSDRLALITGQIAALPPPGPSPKHSKSQSSPASFFLQHQQHEHHHINPSDQNHNYNDHRAGNHIPPAPKHGGLSRLPAFNFGNKVETRLPKSATTNVERATKPPPDAVELKRETQPKPSTTPRFSKPPVPTNKDAAPHRSFASHQLSFFTAKDINSCIMTSENFRLCCSVVIALLVVLSNIGLPRDVVKSRSIIASKPIYLLLVSDVTIVVARLLEKRRSEERIRGEAKITAQQQDGRDWTDAVFVLEVSLVAYQAIRAIFIDLSLYMVVVISGLSLV